MLITPVPPVACAMAFSTQLPMFLPGAPGLTRQAFLSAPPALPSPAELVPGALQAQQVFFLGLNQAANNSGTINPPAAGWRFLASDASSSTSGQLLARVVQIPPSPTWKLTGVFYGPRVSDAFAASEYVQNLPEVAKNDYVLRILAVPGLNLEAFWLVAQNAGSFDLIVPFPRITEQLIPALRSQIPYKLGTFLALIRPLAGGLLTMTAGYGA
jgi:hypothetical protein